MKKFVVCFALLILIVSCSSDDDLRDIEPASKDSSHFAPFPENPQNRMDFVGKEYYSALKNFYQNNESSNSITEIARQINYLSNRSVIKSTTSRGVISFTDAIVESIMLDPENSMIQIVNSSSLSTDSKASIISFLLELINKRQLEFSEAYNYIVSYEDDIIGDNFISEDEKDTLLTISSISRYSLYSEAERKDRDWETSTGSKSVKSSFNSNDISIVSIIAMLQRILMLGK